MWLAINKTGNGAKQLMSDEEKLFWESGPYSKVWDFVRQPAKAERAILPDTFKKVSQQQTKPKRKRAKKSQ
jgi:hypothetical protein